MCGSALLTRSSRTLIFSSAVFSCWSGSGGCETISLSAPDIVPGSAALSRRRMSAAQRYRAAAIRRLVASAVMSGIAVPCSSRKSSLTSSDLRHLVIGTKRCWPPSMDGADSGMLKSTLIRQRTARVSRNSSWATRRCTQWDCGGESAASARSCSIASPVRSSSAVPVTGTSSPHFASIAHPCLDGAFCWLLYGFRRPPDRRLARQFPGRRALTY